MDNTLRVGKILRRLRGAKVVLSSEDRENTRISAEALSMSRRLKRPRENVVKQKYREVQLRPLNEEWNEYVAYQKELKAGKMLKPVYYPEPPKKVTIPKASGGDNSE